MICNVCGEREAIGVASSSAGAISFAYCAECAAAGREPYWAIVAALVGIRSFKDVANWFKPVIISSIEAAGRSPEELFQDVRNMEVQYEELNIIHPPPDKDVFSSLEWARTPSLERQSNNGGNSGGERDGREQAIH